MTLSIRSSANDHSPALGAFLASLGVAAALIATVAVMRAPAIDLGGSTGVDTSAAGLAAQRAGEIMAGSTAAGVAEYRAGEIGASATSRFAAPANEWARLISEQQLAPRAHFVAPLNEWARVVSGQESTSTETPSHPLDVFRGR